jgi:hypothetical protein
MVSSFGECHSRKPIACIIVKSNAHRNKARREEEVDPRMHTNHIPGDCNAAARLFSLIRDHSCSFVDQEFFFALSSVSWRPCGRIFLINKQAPAIVGWQGRRVHYSVLTWLDQPPMVSGSGACGGPSSTPNGFSNGTVVGLIVAGQVVGLVGVGVIGFVVGKVVGFVVGNVVGGNGRVFGGVVGLVVGGGRTGKVVGGTDGFVAGGGGGGGGPGGPLGGPGGPANKMGAAKTAAAASATGTFLIKFFMETPSKESPAPRYPLHLANTSRLKPNLVE